MYGSSFRIETWRPRALRSRPTLAAVMPLPREEVTPPVTKTYFAMGSVLRGFFECYRTTRPSARRDASADWLRHCARWSRFTTALFLSGDSQAVGKQRFAGPTGPGERGFG